MNDLILGNHYLIDFYGCSEEMLKVVNKIKEIMLEAGRIGKLHIVEECFHQFKPSGVSGVLVLKESHFTIHTWPEYNYASVDLYLCDKTIAVSKIIKYLALELKSKDYDVNKINRALKDESYLVGSI